MVSVPATTNTPCSCAASIRSATAASGSRTRSAPTSGVKLIAGDTATAETDQLVYLGAGREAITLRAGADGARVLLLGGEPFAEEIVMWWNFIGRDHDEVAAFREQWDRRDDRFPPVVDRHERVMEAPTMPTVPLKARPRRQPRRRP